MNEYTKCLYDHMLEHGLERIRLMPEYQSVNTECTREENAFLATLTPEQTEQFYRCKEWESALEEISLRYMFSETLHLLRNIFFC